ncbi:LuxR family transcriptional regulator [Luedemannella flava]
MLDALGLSAQDEAVYTAVLRLPHLGVAGLAEHLSLTEADVRAALENLIDLALIRTGPAGALQAVRPQAGLTALLLKAEAEIATRQHQIEATRAAVAAIATAYHAHDTRESVTRLDDIDVVRERLVELAAGAQVECASFTPGGAQSAATIAAEAPLNRQALQRGVRIRNLYQDSFRNDPVTLAHAREMAGHGSQSRTVASSPADGHRRPADRADTDRPGQPRGGGGGDRDPRHRPRDGALFEHVWSTATPIGDDPPRDDRGLSPQERELLRLLSIGHTDEYAARQLGVSLRSVQRMMALVSERVGASSRFQVGVEACRRGWI